MLVCGDVRDWASGDRHKHTLDSGRGVRSKGLFCVHFVATDQELPVAIPVKIVGDRQVVSKGCARVICAQLCTRFKRVSNVLVTPAKIASKGNEAYGSDAGCTHDELRHMVAIQIGDGEGCAKVCALEPRRV